MPNKINASVTASHDPATLAAIDTAARKAAAGTLKRVYTASGNPHIWRMIQSLQADFTAIRNPIGHPNYIISDAYDLYMTAYSYLYNAIVRQGLDMQSEQSVTLKGGTVKTRTVYQWSCVAVRRAIYANKAIEDTGKYIYLEDLSGDAEDASGLDALDREYIRMGKYDGIDNWQDYTDITDMINAIGLTDRQETLVRLKLRGLSVTAIASQLGVSKAAISKQLAVAGNKLLAAYPDMARNIDIDKWTR